MKILSPLVHSVIGFIVGVVLVLAPNIFGFSDISTAAIVTRIIGAIVIVSELSLRGGFSGMGFVDIKSHLGMDSLVGLVLALSPWIFGFHNHGAHTWVPQLVIGLLILGYVPMTQTNIQPTAHTRRHA